MRICNLVDVALFRGALKVFLLHGRDLFTQCVFCHFVEYEPVINSIANLAILVPYTYPLFAIHMPLLSFANIHRNILGNAPRTKIVNFKCLRGVVSNGPLLEKFLCYLKFACVVGSNIPFEPPSVLLPTLTVEPKIQKCALAASHFKSSPCAPPGFGDLIHKLT